MMQIELIEGMIANKLELSGMQNEGCEGQCRSLLYHLFTAVEIFRLMIPQEKETVAEWYQFFAKDFRVNLFLKELKSKKNKEKTAPAPHRKEKNKKEKSQKITKKRGCGSDSVLKEKQNEFWKTLLPFMEKYGQSMLERFQAYWAAPVNGTTTLLWETKKTWSVSYRLKSWSKSPIEQNAQNAEIRLERVKGKKSAQAAANTAELQAIAAKREQDNARLEQEIKERKQGAVAYEEYLKMKKHEGNAEIGTGA